MLYYGKVDVSEDFNVGKTSASVEGIICQPKKSSFVLEISQVKKFIAYLLA